MRGIMTSISTTSGRSASAVASPSSPSRADNTSKPAFCSLIWINRNTSGSSSTASTRIDIGALLLLAREGSDFVYQGVHVEGFLDEVGGSQRQHACSRTEQQPLVA